MASFSSEPIIAEGETVKAPADTTTAASAAGGSAPVPAVPAGAHLCSTPGCGKVAEMACPTCLKLGLPPSRFCGQDCFKSNWNEHKLLHKLIKQARDAETKADPTSMPTEFAGFSFTGNLRPCQVTPRRSVPAAIARPDYAEHPQVSTGWLFFSRVYPGWVGLG